MSDFVGMVDFGQMHIYALKASVNVMNNFRTIRIAHF